MQGDQWAPHGSATASTDVSMQPSLFVPAANNEQQQQQQEMNQPMQFMPSQFQPPPAQQYNPMDANQQYNNNNNNQQQQQQQKEQEQCTKSFLAPRRGFHDAHECVETALDISNIKYGLMNVLIKHTSASLTINDPKYATELEKELNELIPERWNDEFLLHTMEGRDDCPAHIKATLVGETMNVPIKDGKLLLLSEDDRMMICEHRNVGGYTNGFKRDFVTTAVHGIDQKICTIENKGNKIFNVSDIIREFVQNNNKEIKIVHVFAPNGGVFISRIEDAHAFYERVVTKITSKALRKSIVGATEMLTCCDGTVEFGGMSAFVVIDSESRTTTTTEFVLTGL